MAVLSWVKLHILAIQQWWKKRKYQKEKKEGGKNSERQKMKEIIKDRGNDKA